MSKNLPDRKKVLEREGQEIGHLRGNLTSGHNTCGQSLKNIGNKQNQLQKKTI